MNKLLIVRTDNSTATLEMSDAELIGYLANTAGEHDITENLTMWLLESNDNAPINAVANSIYDNHRGLNDSLFAGDVVFTGKSTLSKVFTLDTEAEQLVMEYVNKENPSA